MKHTPQLTRLVLASSLSVSLMVMGGASLRTKATGSQDGESGRAGQGRLQPPSGLSCDRNNTTSFTGRITGYARTSRSIFIRVRTDEQTTEAFTIRLRRGEDASKKFLFEGAAFKATDWKKVEKSRGVLRPKMRATIWACRDDNDDFHAELIDWRPNESEGSFVL